MPIYEPVYNGEAIYSGGVGKDSPYGKATGLYKPALVGPGSGRIKLLIKGAHYVHRYFRKNPRFGARIGAVVTGAGVEYASRNKYRKTYRPVQSFRSGKRRIKYSRTNARCCYPKHECSCARRC